MPNIDRTSQPDGAVREDSSASWPGIVVRAHGLWYEVKITDGPRRHEVVIATMRGQLKKERRRTDIVAVGDRVTIIELPDDEAAIVEVEPRAKSLIRTARNTRDTEQVILANLDQVAFVFSLHDPEPHVRMLDRFLILAARQDLPARIVINKCELDNDAEAEELFGPYRSMYPVHFVSAKTGLGIDDLARELQGKLTAFAGPSGVGKSTLLNAIDPHNNRETGDVSMMTGKGKHTTIGSRIYELEDNTFVADTPGMRALAMHAVPPDELPRCFIEFRPFLDACFYPDCTHTHEPSCVVKDAVADGTITQARYDSYVAIRSGADFGDREG